MIPPIVGDTSLIDTPELWLNRSLDDIVDFRSMLIRGKHTVDVYDVESSNKNVEYTRELALSKNSVFVPDNSMTDGKISDCSASRLWFYCAVPEPDIQARPGLKNLPGNGWLPGSQKNPLYIFQEALPPGISDAAIRFHRPGQDQIEDSGS